MDECPSYEKMEVKETMSVSTSPVMAVAELIRERDELVKKRAQLFLAWRGVHHQMQQHLDQTSPDYFKLCSRYRDLTFRLEQMDDLLSKYKTRIKNEEAAVKETANLTENDSIIYSNKGKPQKILVKNIVKPSDEDKFLNDDSDDDEEPKKPKERWTTVVAKTLAIWTTGFLRAVIPFYPRSSRPIPTPSEWRPVVKGTLKRIGNLKANLKNITVKLASKIGDAKDELVRTTLVVKERVEQVAAAHYSTEASNVVQINCVDEDDDTRPGHLDTIQASVKFRFFKAPLPMVFFDKLKGNMYFNGLKDTNLFGFDRTLTIAVSEPEVDREKYYLRQLRITLSPMEVIGMGQVGNGVEIMTSHIDTGRLMHYISATYHCKDRTAQAFMDQQFLSSLEFNTPSRATLAPEDLTDEPQHHQISNVAKFIEGEELVKFVRKNFSTWV